MFGRHVKVAVIFAVVVVMVVEGYFVYRFYEGTPPYESAAGAASEVETMPPDAPDVREGEKTTPGEVDPPDRAAGSEENPTEVKGAVTFVHRAASENTNANSTYLDHPSANGNPDAFLLITPVWEPEDSEINNAHPVGVWYNGERERWAVYNQDLAPMLQGAVFNVSVSKRSGGALFVHRATAGEVPDNTTYLDHPMINGKPEAILQVTPNWNPGGRGAVYDNHPVGTFYDSEKEKWAVFNQDAAPMPNGAAFNVAVSGVSVPTS